MTTTADQLHVSAASTASAVLAVPGALDARLTRLGGPEFGADTSPAVAATRRVMRTLLIVLAVVAVASVGGGAYYASRATSLPQVVTAPASRGPVTKIVAASGTVQAVTTVSVGTQVSGTVSWLGADFNSVVRKGQVIARLDPSLLAAQVAQARAGLAKAAADLQRDRVGLADARVKQGRAAELSDRKLLPRSDLDAASVAVDSANASLAATQAQVTQAQASLNQAQLTLDHTVIAAPIDGTVTQRSVDVGQTVAASLSSPTIFIIAADLTKMQVSATIDESDIGQIQAGQRVTFNVDAYPDERFAGTVSQVRLQGTVVSNVTTYSTIIDVPNPDLKLKPGMTANVTVIVASRADVLRVPSSALRIRPTVEVLAAFGRTAPTGAAARRGSAEGQVWTFAGGKLSPVRVRLGISDSAFTEVLEPSLPVGAQVVTAITSGATTGAKSATTGNPLTPSAGGRQGMPR
jgi:HlyD family secretion protein